MTADVLHPVRDGTTDILDTDGEWSYNQDPDSGEIIREWQAHAVDDPNTPEDESLAELNTFSCVARGIIDGGIRVAGTTEMWDQLYRNVDFVRITFGAGRTISKRDKITNIRGSNGEILWKEEEQPLAPPTVFDVMGVTPTPDPFGRPMEFVALLQRSEIQ